MPQIDLPAPYLEEVLLASGLVEGDAVCYENPS